MPQSQISITALGLLTLPVVGIDTSMQLMQPLLIRHLFALFYTILHYFRFGFPWDLWAVPR